jgi:hypothetical protein
VKRFVRRVRHATAQRQRPGKGEAGFQARRNTCGLNLGLGRSTAWAFLNRDESTGATAKVFKRILSSPNLPVAVRRKIEEYVKEKSSGLYGHSERQSEAFRAKLRTPDWRQRRLEHLSKLSGARPRTVTCLCWLLCVM